MLQLQHQFLHPLEHRLPFGSSAFRPLGSLGGPLAPSAFAPPHKRPKLEAAAGSGESAPSTPTPSLPGMFSPQALPQQQQQQQQPQAGAAAAELAPHSPAHSHSSSRSPSAGTPAHQLAQLGAQLGAQHGQPDEEREASATPCSDNTDASSTPDEPRPYRMGHVFGGRCGAEALGLGLMSLNPAYRFALPPGLAAKTTRCLVFDQGKKKFNAEPQCCPVCGVTVRGQELEQHFLQELDRLYKLSSASARPRPARPSLPPAAPEHPHGQPMLHTPSAADGTPIGRWETYKRIKANRQARIRVKNRKRKADEPACPVCNERLSGSVEELNQHVERCLNKQNGNPDRHQLDDEEVDVEGDAETFEEYEWAGQRRVRASSMLLGGYSGLGGERRSRAGAEAGGHDDEEMELVVDGDESAQFGPSQYGEADVVQPRLEGSAREQKEREALREAVISPNASAGSSQLQQQQQQQQQQQLEVKTEPSASPSSTSQQLAEARGEPDDGPASSTSPPTSTMLLDAKSEPEAPVVEALRARVRELEAEMRTQPFKCLICMEQYKKPVTSVCCWHVHCEQCWLHTLGAKKLCPQCNMITSPSDLRRIYM